MILAAPNDVPEESTETGAESLSEDGWSDIITSLKYSALVLNPIFYAYGTIMMRQMKNLDENVVSAYSNFWSIPVLVAVCLATGSDLSVLKDFEILQWFCLVALSVLVILA